MAEPVIKRRILKKVRRQFLHKQPGLNDDADNYTNLIATPEQLNENEAILLDGPLGLIETNRTIRAGYQFLNSHYKVSSIRVEHELHFSSVTLNLQSNDMDILPWEYCTRRLESYGDLDLAIWARRLKSYHENYPKIMNTYLTLIKSADAEMSAVMAAAVKQAMLACKELESKYPFCKQTLYGTRNSMVPVSFTLNEKMLEDMGHTVDSFVQWTKQHGIPGLFGKASTMTLDLCKQHMTNEDVQFSFFQEGLEYMVDFYDKEGQKKPRKVKLYYGVNPMPEGFLVDVYVVQKDKVIKSVNGEENGSSFGGKRGIEEDKDNENESRCKRVKKKDSVVLDDGNHTIETHKEESMD